MAVGELTAMLDKLSCAIRGAHETSILCVDCRIPVQCQKFTVKRHNRTLKVIRSLCKLLKKKRVEIFN